MYFPVTLFSNKANSAPSLIIRKIPTRFQKKRDLSAKDRTKLSLNQDIAFKPSAKKTRKLLPKWRAVIILKHVDLMDHICLVATHFFVGKSDKIQSHVQIHGKGAALDFWLLPEKEGDAKRRGGPVENYRNNPLPP